MGTRRRARACRGTRRVCRWCTIPQRSPSSTSSADDYDQLFYYGEGYHQQYLAKPGARPYCSAQPLCVSLPEFESWAPEHLKEKHAPKLTKSFWEKHAPSPHCVINSPNEPIVWEP